MMLIPNTYNFCYHLQEHGIVCVILFVFVYWLLKERGHIKIQGTI